jgi:hypothetical protein
MATPRKNTKLAKRRRMMKSVSENRAFYLNDGKRVDSIIQLAYVLDRIDDNVFRSHVCDERNDFSRWVEDIFGDKKLSKKLRNANDRLDAQIVVLKHLVGGLS